MKELPSTKEMMLDNLEVITRWILIIGFSLWIWTKISAFLDFIAS